MKIKAAIIHLKLNYFTTSGREKLAAFERKKLQASDTQLLTAAKVNKLTKTPNPVTFYFGFSHARLY